MSWHTRWHTIHDWYEDKKAALIKWLPDKQKVEQSSIPRFFGSTLLKKELWSFKREPLARGLGLGLFVAVTPTMGLQWILAALLVIIVPGNLPIALAACLVTNPLTTPAFLYAEFVIGEWFLGQVGMGYGKPFDISLSVMDMPQVLSKVGASIVVGSILLGAVLGVAGYFFVHAFVAVERKLKRAKLLHRRKERKGGGAKPS